MKTANVTPPVISTLDFCRNQHKDILFLDELDLAMTKGIATHIEQLPDGTARLIFDDISSSNQIEWKRDSPYTHRDIDLKKLEDLCFTDKELADFGLDIIVRLRALYRVSK